MNEIDRRHQEAIEKAEASVSQVREEVAKDPRRMKYHLMAPAYWINDPCGLVQFQGEYHIFYQFNPYSPLWGDIHWGHAKSRDLVHWEHLPIAIAPSEPYDTHPKGGIFTGCAMADDDKIKVIYCGSTWAGENLRQVQCLATSQDGIRFHKYEHNPVIPGFPPEGSENFRDPNIWKHGDTYYMVLGSCKDNRGKALLYTSKDMVDWEYKSVLAESDGSLGTMWECPDFFPLDGKYVLIFSPMGLSEVKGLYLVGDFDYESGTFHWQTKGELDYGFEYYAPQTFEDNSHRRVMFGWLNSWDWMPWFTSFGPTVEQNWCGSISLPRVLHLDEENRLIWEPAEETAALRGERFHWESAVLLPGSRFIRDRVSGECLEIEIKWDILNSSAKQAGVYLRMGEEEKIRTVVQYDLGTQELSVDRSQADNCSKGISRCTCLPEADGTLTLRIFADTSCIELFANGGKSCMTNLIYPDPTCDGIEIFCRGGSAKLLSLDIWKLNPIG